MAKAIEIKFICQLQSVTMKRSGKDELSFLNLELDNKQVGQLSDIIKHEEMLKVTIDGSIVFGAIMTGCKAGKTDQPKFKDIDLTPEQAELLCARVKKESEVSVLIEIDTEGQFAFVKDDPKEPDSLEFEE